MPVPSVVPGIEQEILVPSVPPLRHDAAARAVYVPPEVVEYSNLAEVNGCVPDDAIASTVTELLTSVVLGVTTIEPTAGSWFTVSCAAFDNTLAGAIEESTTFAQ